MSFVKTENGRGQCLTDDLKTMRAWYSSIDDRRIVEDNHCPRALRAKRLLTSALVASMHQPVGLSFEVAPDARELVDHDRPNTQNSHCRPKPRHLDCLVA